MKFFLCLLFYFAAIAFFYAGTEIAPQMTFPKTQSEWFACNLLAIGFACKLLGHAFFFGDFRK